MEIRFDGKRVLITGAGKGIGREVALLLASCGAKVVALSRSAADLESLAREIDCETIAVDIADYEATRAAVQAAGDIDLLVNNAAITIPQSFFETTVEAFDATYAVNTRGVLVISQVVAAGMVRRGKGGAIVNVSSLSSKVGLEDHAAYCASKGALDQLSRVMALELGEHQIRVNVINPVITWTPMADKVWTDGEKTNAMKARIPLHRFARPLDVAHAIAYLLSDESDMINGITLMVDGGFLAR
ncbi:MAG TPA: glucose 1-dehydrogenase [Ktedonobacteraceae bacterium]|jgi:NAD(P)-dependent dehydrogenase (short-subunit alcohol dehydrogenase family)|nr:glucose 1-dehydrogenase [Ktedonobacteraceae bacterium]